MTRNYLEMHCAEVSLLVVVGSIFVLVVEGIFIHVIVVFDLEKLLDSLPRGIKDFDSRKVLLNRDNFVLWQDLFLLVGIQNVDTMDRMNFGGLVWNHDENNED